MPMANHHVPDVKTIATPWAVCGPLTTLPSHSAAVQRTALRTSNRFHHYYKKHMTLAGLRKELDSSDTDSETSTNFQTKVFRRRHHKVAAVVTVAQREAAAVERRRAAHPWEYHPNHLGAVGRPAEGDTTDWAKVKRRTTGGKKVLGQFQGKDRYNAEPRRPQLAVRERHAASALDHYSTSLLSGWDDREADRAAAARQRKRDTPASVAMFSPLPVLAATPSASGGASTRGSRAAGAATRMRIGREVDRIAKGHREAMKLHEAVMGVVKDPR
jgi:hypothetical protein